MTQSRIIAIDGMGGDHAPDIVVQGVDIFARAHGSYRFVIHGDEAKLKPLLAQTQAAAAQSEIRHAERAVAMDAKPTQAVRQGKGSSMWNAIEMVKSGEASSAVSAGNTGALMGMSKLILRTVPGVHRPALVGTWPTRKGESAVLDLGADIDADAEQMVEFAIMGASFARAAHHKPRPRVGLLNIGSEDLKGHEDIREAARLIRELDLDFDFHGFVEGDDIGAGTVDVVVTDGFTGNVALKTAEGVARMITGLLRESLTSTLTAKIGAAILMPALKGFRERLDPGRANGAVLLGLNGLVVKSHGGADAAGYAHAIAVAADMGESRFRSEIEQGVNQLLARKGEQKAQEGASEEPAR
ncbi:MAG: phosphate acyltransferase PlsX [Hyphomonadaceae bacterium]